MGPVDTQRLHDIAEVEFADIVEKVVLPNRE